MLQDSIQLVEGSKITNLTLDSGTSDPISGTAGELFFRTDTSTLRVHNGTSWSDVTSGGGGGLSNIVEDTTPQLGGSLDVNGYSISGAPAPSATGTGGNLILIGGLGGSTSGLGGTVLIYGGSPQGTDQGGGAALLSGGYPTGAGAGGQALVQGGGSNTTAATGGNAIVQGGYTGSGSAGDAVIDGGRGYQAGGSPGDVRIRPGINTTDVTQGLVIFETQTGSVPPSVCWKNGSYHIALKAPSSLVADRTWLLPKDDPTTASGKFLTTDASGNLSFADAGGGIGDTAATPDTLALRDSNADLYAANFVSTSDVRLKENVRPIENALDMVMRLDGKMFNFIGNEKDQLGLIAQEVEQVVPQVVNTNSEGFKSVNYPVLVALLIEAVKELARR